MQHQEPAPDVDDAETDTAEEEEPDETPEAPTPRVVSARATVNLPGLKHGQVADVDAAEPFIASCIRDGLLVVQGGDTAAQEAPLPAEAE